MDSNETQIIEGNATLVLNDNMLSTKSLKSSSEITSQSKKVSNYCLCLNTQNQTTNILDGPVSILPLSIGLNRIGRSNENTIIILNKNISREHAVIELIEKENGDLNECIIWDSGSLNKVKIRDEQDSLEKNVKTSLKLNDMIQFGFVKFNLIKMTDFQLKEQENKRTTTLELSDSLYDFTSNKLNRSGFENSSKLADVFPNTLDETYLIENENILKNSQFDRYKGSKIYVEETDPEDEKNDTNDFHLEMSASMNQSVFSTNQTKSSFIIPETLDNIIENDEKKAINLDFDYKITKENDSDILTIKDTLPLNESIENKIQLNDKESHQIKDLETENIVNETYCEDNEQKINGNHDERFNDCLHSQDNSQKKKTNLDAIIITKNFEITTENSIASNVLKEIKIVSEEESLPNPSMFCLNDRKEVFKENNYENDNESFKSEVLITTNDKNIIIQKNTDNENESELIIESTFVDAPEKESNISFLSIETKAMNEENDSDLNQNIIKKRGRKSKIVRETEKIESKNIITRRSNRKSLAKIEYICDLDHKKKSDKSNNKQIEKFNESGINILNNEIYTNINQDTNIKESNKLLIKKLNLEEINDNLDELSTIQIKSKEKESTESKLSRRSSLRIRNNASSENSTNKQIDQTSNKENTNKRRKTLDSNNITNNKKQKNLDAKIEVESRKIENCPDSDEHKNELKNELASKEVNVKAKHNKRRNTISISSYDANLNKAKKIDPSKIVTKNKIDTYKYDDSSDEDESKNIKSKYRKKNFDNNENITTKKKEKLDDSNTNENEINIEKISKIDESKKTKYRKRKSSEPNLDKEIQSNQEQKTNIFFQSKSRSKTSEASNSTAFTGESSCIKKTAAINKPSYTSISNNSKIDQSSNGLILDTLSPNKKFKLLKSKSSSSENYNTSESDNEGTSSKKFFLKETKSPVLSTSFKKNISINENVNEYLIQNNKSLEKSENISFEENKKEMLNSKVKERTTGLYNNRLSMPASSRQNSRNSKEINSPKIMTTGILLTDKQKKIVSELGGIIVDDVKECTHLITNKIRKTYKFLSCLNKSTLILNERWLDECNRNKMFSNTATFALNDAQFEKQYKFTLKNSLVKAKSHQLFKNWKFIIKCKNDDHDMTVDNIKTIIECGGGKTIQSLPKDKDLNQFCLIYDDIESAKKDKQYFDVKVFKILLDNFFNCILTQSFDDSNLIL